MSDPTNPIYVSPDQDLAWSPHAPPLTFRVQEGGWSMGDNFRLQHLRLEVKDKGKARHTFVNRDEQGQVYYLPHWPLFTALADAQTEPEIAAAARDLARLDPGQAAPELGFGMPVAIHLVTRKAPAAGNIGKAKGWKNERTFLSYWSKLDPTQKERAATVRAGEWGLLDLAIRSRQFLVAEELWNAGLRFSPALAKQGTPAWALTEGLFDDIPSYDELADAWKGKRTQAFLLDVIEKEDIPDLERWVGDWRDHPGKPNAFVALTQRWLRRMKEDGVDFNATVRVTTTDGGQKHHVGFRTPFMQALKRPANQGWDTQRAETRVWARAMLDGTYNVKNKVVEPFLLGMPEPGNIATLADKVCTDEEVISWITEAFLEKQMKPAPLTTPKARF